MQEAAHARGKGVQMQMQVRDGRRSTTLGDGLQSLAVIVGRKETTKTKKGEATRRLMETLGAKRVPLNFTVFDASAPHLFGPDTGWRALAGTGGLLGLVGLWAQ